MNQTDRISSFSRLGQLLKNYVDPDSGIGYKSELMIRCKEILDQAVKEAELANTWFTKEHILISLAAWGDLLGETKICSWITPYLERIEKCREIKKVGIVMAGNIPLAGFHDLLCVLISGHHAKIKCSADDGKLIPAVIRCLSFIDSSLAERTEMMESNRGKADSFIATGSNNTSRYFEYYFGKYPNIIRKNRTGVAVLTGKESETELKGIAFDVFTYFGLGCRNVSRLFIPKGFEFDRLQEAFSIYQYFGNHVKYKNNLDYFKSISLVNKIPFIDGGFYILIENPQFESPVTVIHYSFYVSMDEVINQIKQNSDRIQCIICHENILQGAVKPGNSQYPELGDYADGVDTMKFLN